jgi:hypothetical protein
MRLLQIFLPLYDNAGKRFPTRLYARERERLVERFGGVTAHMQAPVKGLWKTGSKMNRDDLVIFEVMVRKVDRKWWSHYRHLLQKRFRQKELLVRSQEVKII